MQKLWRAGDKLFLSRMNTNNRFLNQNNFSQPSDQRAIFFSPLTSFKYCHLPSEWSGKSKIKPGKSKIKPGFLKGREKL